MEAIDNRRQVAESEPLVVSALKGIRRERVPVWFMRQAGRFLPEYRAIREKHSMLDVIRTPALAAQVTLQPVERFDLDAAIIFADILNPLIGMGIELDFVEGEGPKIFTPVRAAEDVNRLTVPTPEKNVGYTLEAIELVACALRSKNVPVLGFAGAPFTLSSYLLEAGAKENLPRTKYFMHNQPSAWHDLQQKLIEMLTGYLVAQAKAGAAAVQIFDSWVGSLSPLSYEEGVLPYMQTLIRQIKAEVSVPVIYFATGTGGMIELIARTGADALSVDWRQPLAEVSKRLGHKVPLQGNLDPILLAGDKGRMVREIEWIVQQGRSAPGHVFNVGHGLVPQTPIENVQLAIDTVRRVSMEH
jgi:uroporphyrinogen decarboxylase